ncbi:MAG: ATP-binding protein [Planctomycetota bacterium]
MDNNERLATISQAFSPNTPINSRDLFCGRLDQLNRILAICAEAGTHCVMFGERGVGKTSLANIMHQAMPLDVCVRVPCESTDTLGSIFKKIGRRIQFASSNPLDGFIQDAPQQSQQLAIPEDASVDDVSLILAQLPQKTLLILDEYDRLDHGCRARQDIAELLKTLSDTGLQLTVLLVGVANDLIELTDDHPSLTRCVKEVSLPRMSETELTEIIDTGLALLEMEMIDDIRKSITQLSAGFPHYVHLLCKHSVLAALNSGSSLIQSGHYEVSLDQAVADAHGSLSSTFTKAKMSTRPSYFTDVLFAIGIVEEDDVGTFQAKDLVECLERIGQPLQVEAFAYHLGKLCDTERGPVLEKLGSNKRHRYRLINPIMKPFLRLEYERSIRPK